MTEIGTVLGPWTYIVFILVWAIPVWTVQWLTGAADLLARWKIYLFGTLIPTIYLSSADALAISQGIWSINPARTLGIKIGILPFEEALFFLVTNSFIVGLVILTHGSVARSRMRRLADRFKGTAGATRTTGEPTL